MDDSQTEYLELLIERRSILERQLMRLGEAIRENIERGNSLSATLHEVMASDFQTATAARRQLQVLIDINQNQRIDLDMQYQHAMAQLEHVREQHREFAAGEPE